MKKNTKFMNKILLEHDTSTNFFQNFKINTLYRHEILLDKSTKHTKHDFDLNLKSLIYYVIIKYKYNI